MIYRAELRDRDMNFVTVLDGKIDNLSWGFAPIGGCAEFSFKALSKYCTELQLGANFNFRLYKKNDTSKAFDLIYQGRIENVINEMRYDSEEITVQGYGYQSELSDIVINNTYTSTEVSVIVKHILDNYVVPNTNLTYDASDIEVTSFTPDSIRFSYVTAQEALEKLADITGSREWGVKADRKVYFKARSTTVGFRYPLGGKIKSVKINSSSREIINRVIIVGGDVAGSKFVYQEDYTKSQAKYKRRDRVVQNSAVITTSVAQQMSDAVQAAGNGVQDRGSFVLEDEVILESTIPVPLFKIITREVLWNEKHWSTFLWGGLEGFRIRKINYSIDEVGKLSSSIDIGASAPNIVEDVKQLQFKLNNVIQSEA